MDVRTADINALDPELKQQLVVFLSSFVTDDRLDVFHRALENRTRYIAVVLENLFQSHNASAILRSMDCFGIQDAHIIENEYEYRINPEVEMGASKWLTLYKYDQKDYNTRYAVDQLRKKGYRIVATSPSANDASLHHFDLSSGKVALFFGTELDGVTDTVLDHADAFLKIPMYGFTQSFNVSVSAAIIFQHFTDQLRSSAIGWQLSDMEKNDVLLQWLQQSIRNSNLLVKRFLCDSSSA